MFEANLFGENLRKISKRFPILQIDPGNYHEIRTRKQTRQFQKTLSSFFLNLCVFANKNNLLLSNDNRRCNDK